MSIYNNIKTGNIQGGYFFFYVFMNLFHLKLIGNEDEELFLIEGISDTVHSSIPGQDVGSQQTYELVASGSHDNPWSNQGGTGTCGFKHGHRQTMIQIVSLGKVLWA